MSLGVLAAVDAPPAAAQAAHADRTVAITFDDLPYAGAIGEGDDALSSTEVALLNARVLATLERHSAPATGFVVERTAEALGSQA